MIAFLKKMKLPYTEAENGLEALQAYQSPSIRYDFILMGKHRNTPEINAVNDPADMSMPVMDGMSATRAIRRYEEAYNVPRCCIIALTGLASNSARLEAWNSGIDQYMTKPVNFKKLADALSKEKTRKASIQQAGPSEAAAGEAQAKDEEGAAPIEKPKVGEVAVGRAQAKEEEVAVSIRKAEVTELPVGDTQAKDEDTAAPTEDATIAEATAGEGPPKDAEIAASGRDAKFTEAPVDGKDLSGDV